MNVQVSARLRHRYLGQYVHEHPYSRRLGHHLFYVTVICAYFCRAI